MLKKVAFVGNVGNCTYWYAKFLREAGIDTTLYISFKKYDKLGKPVIIFGQDPREEDASLKGKLPDWVKFFHVYSLKSIFNIRKEFDRYDLNIAFEALPIFLQFSRAPLLSFATGSNLKEQAFEKNLKGVLLKRGFLKSKAVLFDNIDFGTLECLEKLHIRKYEWVPCYVVSESQTKMEKDIINDGFFEKFKEKYLFFSSARLDFRQKGTDVLLKGFAYFLKKNNEIARLILIDYGIDGEKTKEMIDKLGLKGNVTILPVVSRRDDMELKKKCSLSFGYFNNGISGLHHWPFSVMDALKIGSITVSSVDENAFLKIVGEVPPVVKVSSESDLSQKLEIILKNYEKLKNDAAINGPQWIKKYNSKDFIVNKFLKIINEYAR